MQMEKIRGLNPWMSGKPVASLKFVIEPAVASALFSNRRVRSQVKCCGVFRLVFLEAHHHARIMAAGPLCPGKPPGDLGRPAGCIVGVDMDYR